MYSLSSSGMSIKLVQRARDEDEASGSERSWKRSDEVCPRKVGINIKLLPSLGAKSDSSNTGPKKCQRKKHTFTRNFDTLRYELCTDTRCASNGN